MDHFKITLFLCVGFVFVTGMRLPKWERGGINMVGQHEVCRCYNKTDQSTTNQTNNSVQDPAAAPLGGKIKEKIEKFHKFVLKDFRPVHFGICWCTRRRRAITMLTLLRHAQLIIKYTIKKAYRMKCRRLVMMHCKVTKIFSCRGARNRCNMIKKHRCCRRTNKCCKMARSTMINGVRRGLVRRLMKSFKKHIPKSILKDCDLRKVLAHGLEARNGFGVGLQAMGPLFNKLGFGGSTTV